MKTTTEILLHLAQVKILFSRYLGKSGSAQRFNFTVLNLYWNMSNEYKDKGCMSCQLYLWMHPKTIEIHLNSVKSNDIDNSFTKRIKITSLCRFLESLPKNVQQKIKRDVRELYRLLKRRKDW